MNRRKRSHDGFARGFSCPQEGPIGDVIEAITTAYAREYIRRFAVQFGPELDQRGTGLAEVLRRWLTRRAQFDQVWDLSVADARQAVLDENSALLPRRAASLALQLHAHGLPGDWELDLPKRTRLRWQSWLLPEADRVRVKAMGGRAVMRLHRGRTGIEATFRRRGRNWTAEGAERLPLMGGRACPMLLLRNPGIEGLEFGGPLRFARLPESRVRKQCDAAVASLRRHAPAYLRWVKEVVRAIIPVDARRSGIIAGSDFTKPGVVQVSFPVGTMLLCETLVHEASHQHLEIVRRLGPIHNGSDHALYYSPIRKQERPVEKILVAYHAMANVLLYYRQCRKSGLRDGGYVRHHERELLPQLDQLEAPLRRTQGLTALGQALWESLAERIHRGTRR